MGSWLVHLKLLFGVFSDFWELRIVVKGDVL